MLSVVRSPLLQCPSSLARRHFICSADRAAFCIYNLTFIQAHWKFRPEIPTMADCSCMAGSCGSG